MTGEVEYLLTQFRGGNIAPSAFVSAAYGWNNSSNIMAGVRIYFGNHDKTLIRRQREDDPVAVIAKHINPYQTINFRRRAGILVHAPLNAFPEIILP